MIERKQPEDTAQAPQKGGFLNALKSLFYGMAAHGHVSAALAMYPREPKGLDMIAQVGADLMRPFQGCAYLPQSRS